MSTVDQDIEAFLDAYPTMRYRPTAEGVMSLSGRLPFSAEAEKYPHLTDEYRIRIDIKESLERALPSVYETDGRIPKAREYHVNPDESLCLGSLLSVRLALGTEPTLLGFVERCLVPFLYSQSLREQRIANFPFGELAHGPQGLIDDYLKIFDVADPSVLRGVMELMSLKRRAGNKRPCPCGCGRRFAACQLHKQAHKAAATLSRHDLKSAYSEIWS